MFRRQEELFHGRRLLHLCTHNLDKLVSLWSKCLFLHFCRIQVLCLLEETWQNLFLWYFICSCFYRQLTFLPERFSSTLLQTNIHKRNILKEENPILPITKMYRLFHYHTAMSNGIHPVSIVLVWFSGVCVWKTHDSRAFKEINRCFDFLVQTSLSGLQLSHLAF